jgi:hypothetical protein
VNLGKRMGAGLLTLAAGAALSACTPHSSGDSSGDSATFVIGHVASSFSATENHPKFSIPVARTMSLTACINDNQYSKSVKNHAFVIQGGESELTQNTDSDGCLNWQERIAFNQLSDAAYLKVDRVLVAKGYQKGQRTLSLAINPWSNEVLYLKEKSVPSVLPSQQTTEKLKGKGAAHSIWADSIKATVQPIGMATTGTTYHVDVKFDPKIMLKSATGEVVPYSITQGSFTARMSLIRTPQTSKVERHDLVAQSKLLTIDHLVEGNLATSADLIVSGDCSLGSYEIGLDVIPDHGPEGLTALHGIYPIGSCESLIGTKFAQLKNGDSWRADTISNFSIEAYTGTPYSTEGFNTITSSVLKPNAEFENGVATSPVQVATVRVDDIAFDNLSTTRKRHRYFLSVCLVASIDRRPIVNHPVSVKGLSGITQRETFTQTDGCARIEDFVDVNSFEPVCWKRGTVTVTNQQLGLSEVIPVKINAMEAGSPGFMDLRSSSVPDDSSDKACAQQKSFFVAGEFAVDRLSYDYNVDSNLNLILTKKMNILVPLHLNRPSISSSTESQDEKLPIGKYGLRWAVVDIMESDFQNTKGDKIYGAGEQVVDINAASQIQDPLSITLNNLKSLGSTNTLLLEIYPLDKTVKRAVGLDSTVFRAPITLSHENGSGIITLIPNSGGLLTSLTQKFNSARQRNLWSNHALGEKETYANVQGLKLINLSKGQRLSTLSNAQLRNILDTSQFNTDTAQQFCREWVDNVLQVPIQVRNQNITPIPHQGWTNDLIGQVMHRGGSDAKAYVLNGLCMKKVRQNPKAFFDVEFHYITTGATRADSQVSSSVREISISQSFSLSHSFSDSQSASIGAHVDASASLDIPYTPAKVGVGASYSVSHDQSQSASSSNSVSVSNGVGLEFETLQMKIRYSDYEKCLVVRMNPAAVLNKQVHATSGASILTWMPGKGAGSEDLVGGFDSRLDGVSLLRVARRGVMICSGVTKHSERPLVFPENFYVIYQKLSDGQMVNTEADSSRPMFMTLRGRGSAMSFLSFITGAQSVPDSFQTDLQTSHLNADPIAPLFLHADGFAPRHIISTQ